MYNIYIMKIGLFGGTFDPVHSEHTGMCRAAIEHLQLSRLIVLPAGAPPHKLAGGDKLRRADKAHRLNMAKLAFSGIDKAVVDSYEIDKPGESFSYLTIRHFAKEYPQAQLFFIMGADSLVSFFEWKNPQDILKNCTIAACCRSGVQSDEVASAAEKLGDKVVLFPYYGSMLSSSEIRIMSQFGLLGQGLDDNVLRYIIDNGLYSGYREETRAVQKLMGERRYMHTAYTALTAVGLARRLNYDQDKAFIAAMLHDVTKEMTQEELFSIGYKEHKGLPQPVQHAFSGSYWAKHVFNITDREILDAIAYHTTGRPNMGLPGKILYVSDLIEPLRDYDGVNELRAGVNKDFESGFKLCLKRKYELLQLSGKEIPQITTDAYRYYIQD